MPFVESYYEFRERMACGEPLRVNGRLLFPNGAQSDGHYWHREAPDDERERLTLQREFWRCKRGPLVAKYSSDKVGIRQQLFYHRMDAGPMPQPGWQEHLQRLVAEIQAADAELAKIDAAIAALPETDEQRRRRVANKLRSELHHEIDEAQRVLRALPDFQAL